MTEFKAMTETELKTLESNIEKFTHMGREAKDLMLKILKDADTMDLNSSENVLIRRWYETLRGDIDGKTKPNRD